MKKFTIILLVIVFILPISACSNKNTAKNSNEQNPKIEMKSLISKNNKNWKSKVKSTKVEYTQSAESLYPLIPKNLEDFKTLDSTVIEGTILNLEEMYGAKNTATTKATIQVNEIISGKEKVQGQIIHVIFRGGFTSVKDLYDGFADKARANGATFDPESSEKVYIEYQDDPMPEIGSKIITGINPNRSDGFNDIYDKYLLANGLGGKDSYSVSVPEYNIWIKAPNADKFIINNPELNKMKGADSENSLAQQLNQLTVKFNSKYNK
ncbi:hypothetical protein [Lactobacillus terrae]|uniref:hypothetical protein n=1 Tax=Lactobacillus terrae TaxID=2269374 RepID=UPI000C1B7203|nr:hypothetical protein [Lactobacillus terrae]